MYEIRQLAVQDVAAFRQLRLAALHEVPSAFTTSLATELALTEAQQCERIAGPTLSAVWGAWDAQGNLVGSTGLQHHSLDKVRHKALVYAVYVAPQARGAGLSRRLVQAAIDYARAQPLLQHMLLNVTGTNLQAHQLYRSLGFQEYGREPHAIVTDGVLHDQILMWLPLRLAAVG